MFYFGCFRGGKATKLSSINGFVWVYWLNGKCLVVVSVWCLRSYVKPEGSRSLVLMGLLFALRCLSSLIVLKVGLFSAYFVVGFR